MPGMIDNLMQTLTMRGIGQQMQANPMQAGQVIDRPGPTMDALGAMQMIASPVASAPRDDLSLDGYRKLSEQALNDTGEDNYQPKDGWDSFSYAVTGEADPEKRKRALGMMGVKMGLGMMEAGAKPGATIGGSFAAGAKGALGDQEKDREKRRLERLQRNKMKMDQYLSMLGIKRDDEKFAYDKEKDTRDFGLRQTTADRAHEVDLAQLANSRANTEIARLNANKPTLETGIGGNVHAVYPDGTVKPVLKSNGKPLNTGVPATKDQVLSLFPGILKATDLNDGAGPSVERALGILDTLSAHRNGGGGPQVPANMSPTPAPLTPPQVGEVRNGFRYKGGNPAVQGSWEPVR